MSIASALRMGAEGIKVKVAVVWVVLRLHVLKRSNRVVLPLHTFRMDIDYANVFALTVYGKIGIKVWICKGEVLAKRDLNPNFVGGKSDVSDRRERRDRIEMVVIAEMTEEVVVTEEAAVVETEEVVAVAVARGGGGGRSGGQV